MMRAIGVASVLLMQMFVGAWSAQAEYRYVFDQADYQVSPGGTVAVGVYLQETDTTALVDYGLYNAGVTVRSDNSPQPSDPAKVATVTNIIKNPAFELLWNRSVGNGYGALLEGTMGAVYGVSAGPNTYRALLGTFTFTAGALGGEITHISATDYSINDDTAYWGDSGPVILDGDIAIGRATITTTPEPSTLMLGSIASLALFAFYFWKR